jgi:signal peptidase
MRLRKLLTRAVTLTLVIVALTMVVGQTLGQPLLFGFVTTGSMEPTLSPGDGFVAVPPPLADDPEPGDVVVFEAETIQGGGLTTHRVVEETERGYVTHGDANPFTDQDGGEPYVAEGEILAYALQVNGEVVVIPNLGTFVTGVRNVVGAPFALLGSDNAATVLVFVGIVLFLFAGATGDRNRRTTSRSPSRQNVLAVWLVVLAATLVVTTAATLAMVVPASGYDVEALVTDSPDDNPQVVAPGGTATVTYEVHNAGVVPAMVVTEPADDAVTVDPERTVLGFDGRTEVTVGMAAPERTGTYTYRVRESRYLVVLPPTILAALHEVHPLVALLVVDLVVASFVVAVALAVFGTGYLRMRSRPDVPLKIRLRRRLRRFR